MGTMEAKGRIGDAVKEIMGGEEQIMVETVSHCKDLSFYAQ